MIFNIRCCANRGFELEITIGEDKYMMTRLLLIFILATMVSACGYDGTQVTRIHSRVSEPVIAIEPGEHELGLDGPHWVPAPVARDIMAWLKRWS